MIVSEIYTKIKNALGNCGQELVFDRISDAVEALANKGQWDPLQAYIDLQGSADSNLMILPEFVEAPMKININKQPSFARGKLFEFRQNTDGTAIGDELGWAWADRGEVPYSIFPTDATFQLKASITGVIRAYGYDVNNREIFDANGLPGYLVTTVSEGPIFKTISSVSKDATIDSVTLSANDQLIALYEPRAYDPLYRVIKLSKKAAAIRMLFRRRTFRVQSLEDWIPLNSRLAIQLMVQAVSLWTKGQEIEIAEKYEAQALKLLQEEQDSRNVFSSVSDSTEISTVRNQTYLTTDAIVVGDIYDDASDIFGAIGRQKLFDKISDAVDLLACKSNWDGLTGVLDLSTAGNCEYTLPDFVETVLKVNYHGIPTLGHNKWFEFHLNGPGSWDYAGQFTWKDRGDFPTFKDIQVPAQLIVFLDSATDNNIQIRVKGWDEKGNRIFQNGQDGFILPAVYGYPFPDTTIPFVGRIESIVAQSDPQGFIKISALDSGREDGTLLAVLEPGQRQTSYRRIKVPGGGSCVKILFRKKTRRINSLNDLIPLESRLAIKMAMMSLKTYASVEKGAAELAASFEATATRLLEEEQALRNPQIDMPVQFDMVTAPGSMYNMT
jgi:hypothetical protein